MLFVRLRDDPKGPATTDLSGDKKVDTADMVGQHKSGRKDGSPETGHARPFVCRRRGLSISNGVLLDKELFCPVVGNVYVAELAKSYHNVYVAELAKSYHNARVPNSVHF